tara:strand:+ start:222 stop:1163 length:942 start_codon:yes stop_codon:yes gene_type:complete
MEDYNKEKMEQFNENTEKEPGLDIAFETTYKIVTGKVKISSLNILKDVYMLYDPTNLEVEELIEILLDMIDYYVESEEYEKCQKLKNILDSDLSELIPKITMSQQDILNKRKKDSMDAMIDLIKDFTKDKLNKKIDWEKENKAWSDNLIKKSNVDEKLFTNEELWSILSLEDKKIFEKDEKKFDKWLSSLENKDRRYYADRLINGLPLIPAIDESAGTWIQNENAPTYNPSEYFNYEEKYEGEDSIDYQNVVVSFVGNLTCISNYSKEKINDIRFQLLKAGVLEVEIRTKDVDGKTLYTIIYDNYGKLNKINW